MQQQNMQQALQGGGFRGGYRPAAPMRGGYGMPRHQKIVDMTKPPPQQQQRARKSQQQRSNAQNMSFAYNAGVEKQFFDQVKDTMTSSSRDGGAWAEFLKCLDMYSQEVLTRAEMLQLVEDLFGKHNDLFQEFKAILAASSSAEVIHDDTWYSVPLSEIDFSRCRKCTPSYRALPRDYPNPPCSERSDEEGKVSAARGWSGGERAKRGSGHVGSAIEAAVICASWCGLVSATGASPARTGAESALVRELGSGIGSSARAGTEPSLLRELGGIGSSALVRSRPVPPHQLSFISLEPILWPASPAETPAQPSPPPSFLLCSLRSPRS